MILSGHFSKKRDFIDLKRSYKPKKRDLQQHLHLVAALFTLLHVVPGAAC